MNIVIDGVSVCCEALEMGREGLRNEELELELDFIYFHYIHYIQVYTIRRDPGGGSRGAGRSGETEASGSLNVFEEVNW